MTIENVAVTDGKSLSPTRSPKHKKRLIALEQHAFPELSQQESTEVRKIFITPFLHYQALMASESISLKLSADRIRELKKIACPMEDMHKPFRSRDEALSAVSGKYHALINELQQYAAQPNTAEGQLFLEVQKTYSAYIQACIAHDEERRAANDRQIVAEKAAKESQSQLEEAQHLEEAKTNLRQIIAVRKNLLTQKLEHLRTSADGAPGYEQLYMLINGLTHAQQTIIREIAPDLPIETDELSNNIKKYVQEQREPLYKELNELEEMETDCDRQSIDVVYTRTMKIQAKAVIPDFNLVKIIDEYAQKFATLKPILIQKASEANRAIDSGMLSINQQALDTKTKYQHKKKDRTQLIEASYQRLSKILKDSKVQDIRRTIESMSFSDRQLDEKAGKYAKRVWNSIPIINLLPPVKKAYSERKNKLKLEFAELKRNKILHNAYANIVESIPQTINRDQNMINFIKIKNALSAVEQQRLVVLPNEKDELVKLENDMNIYLQHQQMHKEIIGLLSQLNVSVAPRSAHHLGQHI